MAGRTILVYDPLYGRIELPGFLQPFLASPEFSRLSAVRLLNFESFELAALSEARRRSHTLGALHLGSRLPLIEFGTNEMRALLIATVLHDVGTPPFGHTLEYELIQRTGMNHEMIVTKILDGVHHPLGLDHQIYAGKGPQLPTLMRESGVEPIVRSILLGTHPLSQCLFGDLDLDNLDNVFRMAWYLGERCDGSVALQIASLLDVNLAGQKILAKEHRPLIEHWLATRARAYSVILNSPRHRQSQAIFSRIVFEAMERAPGDPEHIEYQDWFSTDEQLLGRLRRMERLRPFFSDLQRAEPLRTDTIMFACESRIDRASRAHHQEALARLLADATDHRVYLSFVAIGETLEREVHFLDRRTEEPWSVGTPKLTYRLETHIGESPRSADSASVRRIVSKALRDYANDHEWIGKPGTEPVPPEQHLLEF